MSTIKKFIRKLIAAANEPHKCAACLGFGNLTAVEWDTTSTCHCCQGSGWSWR
jgi:hypothetical protein